MKFYCFVSILSLVVACSSNSKKASIQDIKNRIVFKDSLQLKTISHSITKTELQDYVYVLSSDSFEGRKTGTLGYNKAANYLKQYYIQNGITSPSLSNHDYFQHIPGSFFSKTQAGSHNVLAYIEGTETPEELIIISAHLDHEGIKNGQIYHGADDNASGTAVLMEIAQAFKIAKDKGFGPKRSILFIHLTGEEMGLEGSKYYTKHPLFPLENTIANLNIDMIGRVDKKHQNKPNYIYIIGADRLSTELHYISEQANTQFAHLELDYEFNKKNDPNKFYYRSDHYNFALKGIPSIFYFNGTHDDYHKPSDTADKIDYPLLEQRSKLIFATAWYLVNSQTPIVADKLR